MRPRQTARSNAAGLVLAAVAAAAAGPAVAVTDPPLCTDDAILVFDASSSMQRLVYGGGTRVTVAREAARRIVPAAAAHRRLGLVVYGPGPRGACENIDLRVPPAPGSATEIVAEIEAVETAGDTPLTGAVEQAAEALAFRERKAVVVVVTDGDETCGGDPCAVGARLAREGKGLTVHVVSFELGTRPRFSAACLAEETGGLVAHTAGLDELEAALTRVLACAEVSALAPAIAPRSWFSGEPPTRPATSGAQPSGKY